MKRLAAFSLVELMVATAIGSLVTAAALAGLAHARASWAAAEIENRLHERAQYVLATLETDLQMAGFFTGVIPAPVPAAQLPPGAAACGAEVVGRLDRPVESEPEFTYACAAQGGGHLAGTDVLLLRRASALPASAGTGRMQWLACRTPACQSALQSGRGAPSPVLPPGAELRDLVVRIYYVARGADGDVATPALRVKSLTAIAGAPAFLDTEVMPGVDDLQVTIEPHANQPRSVEVLVSVRADAGDSAGVPRRLSVRRHFALRNAAG
jgi:hypothetical protein